MPVCLWLLVKIVHVTVRWSVQIQLQVRRLTPLTPPTKALLRGCATHRSRTADYYFVRFHETNKTQLSSPPLGVWRRPTRILKTGERWHHPPSMRRDHDHRFSRIHFFFSFFSFWLLLFISLISNSISLSRLETRALLCCEQIRAARWHILHDK